MICGAIRLNKPEHEKERQKDNMRMGTLYVKSVEPLCNILLRMNRELA